MKQEKLKTIKCPKCGKEYLPCEIYLPNSFLGKCYDIERDENLQIISFSGSSMDLLEKFICDNCNTQFKITAKIDFNTDTDANQTFGEDYSTPLVKNNLFMEED